MWWSNHVKNLSNNIVLIKVTLNDWHFGVLSKPVTKSRIVFIVATVSIPHLWKPVPTIPNPAHVSTSLRRLSISMVLWCKIFVLAPLKIQYHSQTVVSFLWRMENLPTFRRMEASVLNSCFVWTILHKWLPGQNMMSSATKERCAPSSTWGRWGSKPSKESSMASDYPPESSVRPDQPAGRHSGQDLLLNHHLGAQVVWGRYNLIKCMFINKINDPTPWLISFLVTYFTTENELVWQIELVEILTKKLTNQRLVEYKSANPRVVKGQIVSEKPDPMPCSSP